MRSSQFLGSVLTSRGLSVCLSVSVLVTDVSYAKTDKPIEMPFGRQICVDPTNYTVYENIRSWLSGFGKQIERIPIHLTKVTQAKIYFS